MLSVAAMAGGQENYYLSLAAEDYYVNGGEPVGRWLGRGAEVLGLVGEVTKTALRNLFLGFAPDGSRPLVQQQRTPDRTRQPGWDLTFSAPKSVSVLWSQTGAPERRVIERAHFAAVQKALAYLEQAAAFSRRGKGGQDLDRAGLVVATFEHGTSRAQDPQLHTHALVLNVAGRPDRTFGTLRSRDLYQHKMAAGALYRTELAHQLQATLGLTLAPKERWFEVVGVPNALLEAFSTRRAEIEKAFSEGGFSSARAKEILALSTRGKKQHVARSDLLAHWRKVGEELGFSQEQVLATLGRTGIERDLKGDLRLVGRTADAAVKRTLASESTFCERDLVRALAESLQATGISTDTLLGEVRSRLTHSPDLVRLDEEGGYFRYTTKEMLDAEQLLFDAADRSRGSEAHRVSERVLSEVVRRYPTIRDDQRAALARITTDPGSLQCVIGMAGTGKTFMLRAAREVWEGAGYKVVGAALAAKAARELEKGAGIKSRTIASLLFLLGRSLASDLVHHAKQVARAAVKKPTSRITKLPIDDRTILVVDEAGMVGTRMLQKLVDLLERRGAKVVLVGDDRQLQPIEAGGPFRALTQRLGAARLTVIERQYEEWMRDAVRQFADGDARGGLTQYALAERLHIEKDRDAAVRRLVSEWATRRTQHLPDSVILGSTNDEVRKLNRAAQAARRKLGELKARGGYSHRGDQYQEGDRIVFTQNDRSLGVFNGDLGTIEKIRSPLVPWKAELTVRLDREHLENSKPLRVTFTTRDYGDFELGYALTTHKAQGMTVERAFVLAGGDMQDREQAYVQMSRAREETRLFVDEGTAGEDLVELARAMSRPRQKDLAHDHIQRPFSHETQHLHER